ncbi:hypothetical protein DPMN_159928 [Dreissena polymorpha]|uniref:Uncharacterized protein n=1 Tax=Dreissena polymorpha TaxID=45954 RepID=A0A9D4IR73_DREPO|nr:hypothetical protein DPMN_159928 [Dreissena polymorpha]
MLWRDCQTLLEVRPLIPLSDNRVSRFEIKKAMPNTLWSAPTQGRSGTGGTTTNARLCILRVRVARFTWASEPKFKSPP